MHGRGGGQAMRCWAIAATLAAGLGPALAGGPPAAGARASDVHGLPAADLAATEAVRAVLDRR